MMMLTKIWIEYLVASGASYLVEDSRIWHLSDPAAKKDSEVSHSCSISWSEAQIHALSEKKVNFFIFFSFSAGR